MNLCIGGVLPSRSGLSCPVLIGQLAGGRSTGGWPARGGWLWERTEHPASWREGPQEGGLLAGPTGRSGPAG